MSNKRKGFTLVELLIVIVVIGILSAMMMLSSSEAMSSAEATKIVSDMRNLKTATLAWCADHMDTEASVGQTNGTTLTINEVLPYLKDGQTVADNDKTAAEKTYTLNISSNGWFVKCTPTGTNVAQVKTKLQSRAKSVGLYANVDKKEVYAGGNDVYMRIK